MPVMLMITQSLIASLSLRHGTSVIGYCVRPSVPHLAALVGLQVHWTIVVMSAIALLAVEILTTTSFWCPGSRRLYAD